MISIRALVFSVLVTASWSAEDLPKEDLSFPSKFLFGVATSSYQIEGAWNVSVFGHSSCLTKLPDKGESIWDRFSHKRLQEAGDVACDSYHLWRRDVEMVQELGVHFYRFSISWTRILPTGFTNRISTNGTKYYNDLIDALLEKGIEPVATLYHWDLPQRLQDLGGWTNPLIAKWFADYSRVVFSLYGDRVKTWITINEPLIICDFPYQYGILAPGIISPEGSMLCSKNVLMAHARAWRVYDEEFRAKYQGRITLTNFEMWLEPVTKEDEGIAELARQNLAGLYSTPIFSKEGGWPPAVEKAIAEYSKKLGYTRSNLPALSKEEIDLLRGTYDFYALNYYTSRTIRAANGSEDLQPWPVGDAPQLNAKLEFDPSWEITATSFYPKHPEGIRKQLKWVKEQYGDIPIMIAENGVGNDGGMQDKDRILFFRDYLKQVLLAIKDDGVNVTAFTAWSLMDSFEWMDGYRPKFGLYKVDFSSSEKTRTPRDSAVFYTNLAKTRSLVIPENLLSDVTVHATTQNTANTSTYIFITGGVLTMAIIATVLVIRHRRSKNKDTYTSVRTDETTRGLRATSPITNP